MGGRGGSSHRGGGGGFGRGHLAEWTDNESALRQIMRDTGLPEAAARQVQQDMIRYFGADYGCFTNGSLPVETQRITDALLKMPYYNAGPIYRGIHVPNAVADRFLQDYQVGTRHSFGILQSFSSREDVAESFGVWNAVYGHTTSIKFVLQGNKTAPSTVHISHFGYSESEVLSPHIQKFEVLRAEVETGAQADHILSGGQDKAERTEIKMREAIRDCLTLLESGYEAEWKGYFPRYDSRLQALRRKVLEREGAQESAARQTKPVDELNVEELLAHLAWIFLAERMSAGFLDTQIRSGELEKLLRRYLDLTEVEG